MPLIKSGSKRVVSKNISEMVASGFPQRQAVAAALNNQRRYAHKQDGGSMASMGAPVPSSSTSPYDPWMYMALMGGGAGDGSMATMGAPVQPITPVPATYRHGGYVYKDDGGPTDGSTDSSSQTFLSQDSMNRALNSQDGAKLTNPVYNSDTTDYTLNFPDAGPSAGNVVPLGDPSGNLIDMNWKFPIR